VRAPRKAGKIAFRPRAPLLKLIGEELISDEVVAMSELVKNAHDADAGTVTIVFEGFTGGDGRIEVIDDGFGMKLGRHLEILSRCPARSDEVRVVIDWDHFDDDSLMLDEVLS
jgi:hypothetical protein